MNKGRIITLWAPNPSAGKRALQAIAQVTKNAGALVLSGPQEDESRIMPATTTTALSSSATSRTIIPHPPISAARTILEFFLPQPQWQSLSLQKGRTTIQCLSLNPWMDFLIAGRRNKKGPPFRVIGIQETTDHKTTNEIDDDTVNNNTALRDDLLAHIYRSVSTATLVTSMILARRLPAALPLWLDVAGSTIGGPDTSTTSTTGGSTCSKDNDHHFEDGDLKEVVLYSSYDDDDDSTSSSSSLLQMLSQSLPSPVTGVYVTPGTGLRIRPLPPAVRDQGPSAPTLIFHRRRQATPEELPKALSTAEDGYEGASGGDSRFRRIGYTGRSMMNGGGQLVFDHADHQQLGLRLCGDTGPPRSMFAEAQDSLLASSIAGLQSNRVVLSKDDNQQKQAQDDPRTNKSDCWVEARAQMVQPLAYWKHRHQS
jgi:hypothetical protein